MDETLFMREALALADQARGDTAPNPCVGAVLVQGDQIVARGWHTACGKPHAEVEALADARRKGVDASQCHMYVTLEPCNHTGKTPPCSEAIIAAGIRRVVVGTADPNPDVAGGGMARLRDAGVEVVHGMLEQECRDALADFTTWKGAKRTYNILKLAATLDGRIATRTGHSRWVSGPESRAEVHRLRGVADAVLVGGGTFYSDDPQLTRRGGDGSGSAENGSQPLAIVATSALPSPDADFHLLRKRASDTIFWTSEEHAASPAALALVDAGVRVWGLPGWREVGNEDTRGLDLRAGFERLHGELGLHYVLCEGGGHLGLGLMAQGLADEFHLFLAPKVLGDAEARPVFAGRAPETMDQALGLRVAGTKRFGDDLRVILRPGKHD